MTGVWRRGCVPVGALSRKYRGLLQELQIVSLDHARAVLERADEDPLAGGHYVIKCRFQFKYAQR